MRPITLVAVALAGLSLTSPSFLPLEITAAQCGARGAFITRSCCNFELGNCRVSVVAAAELETFLSLEQAVRGKSRVRV